MKYSTINLMKFITKKFLQNIFLTASIFVAATFLTASQSLAQLVATTTDSRIRTLVFNPNEVYELKFYYGYQSFIEFADNEEIEMISIGEAFAWRITPAGKRLFIRPLEVAAHTNMTIITSKRTYHFDIRSGEYNGKADEELVYTVRFFYPQIGQPLPIPPALAVAVPAGAPKQQKPAIRGAFPQIRVDDSGNKPNVLALHRNAGGLELNFNYSLAGKSDNILPLKVYDNGTETIMQFANDNLIVPTINSVDAFGSEHQLSYIIRDNYVVLPTVERQLTLRLADSLICIYNNDLLLK